MVVDKIVGRDRELLIIQGFLDDLSTGPRALVLTGEPGIGKTTLWADGVDEARQQSFRTLVCRPAAAEVRLGYAALADLLAEVDDRLLARLPVPQREALDAVLLRRQPATAPDPRAVAAALLTILEQLGAGGPVVVAIDDLQWLDESSARAVAFVARRLSGPIGLLVAMRGTGEEVNPDLQPRDPEHLRHLRVGPLSLAVLHHLLKNRTGRSYPRPVMVRINDAAAGNPFYALEIARALGDGTPNAALFPRSLVDLLDARITALGPEVRETLLAVSAMADPRVDLVRRVMESEDGRHAGKLLERAEGHGVIEIDRGRVRFSHPLLANGVYAAASPEQRRAVHRRLSTLSDGIEERARHMALAALGPEPVVVKALDDAADEALGRGAPAAAAELLELAMDLGADDVGRRIRAADCNCQAGDPVRARSLIEGAIRSLPPGPGRAGALALLGMIHYKALRLAEAATVLDQAIREVGDDLGLRIELELDLAYVLTNLGRIDDARPYALGAVADAKQHGEPGALAQALAAEVIAGFISGRGLDEVTLVQALGLEDRSLRARVHNQPSTIASLCWLFTGRFDEARAGLSEVRGGCLERGEESDVPLNTFWLVLLECWCGHPVAAQAFADDMLDRAVMLDTPVHQAMAMAAQATVGAVAGRAEQTRRDASASLALFETAGLQSWATWPLAALCSLDVSMGDYESAAATSGPIAVAILSTMSLGEPTVVPLLPDVAEALIGLGRLEEAAPLVDQLEERGRTLDRPWALAVGGRNRALLLAAQGDVDAALRAAHRALVEHDRVATPLDRARTLLVQGQLRRRAKEKRLAHLALSEALSIFETIGSPQWAARARDELGRVNVRPGAPLELTATERRIAEFAAQGMTNKQVAAVAFVTPKTVEANLARVYRKLGIGSRAELGALMAKRSSTET